MRGDNTAFLAALLFGTAFAEAASYGKLYTYDKAVTSKSIHKDVFHVDVAKRILGRRMTLSPTTSLGTVDESTIAVIEELGGHQISLFGDDETDHSLRRLLIICDAGNISEGSENVATQGNSISFPSMSSDLITDNFIYDVLGHGQNTPSDTRVCSTRRRLNETSTARSANLQNVRECLSEHEIFKGLADALDFAAFRDPSSVFLDSWVGQDGTIGILKVWSRENVANIAIANAFVQRLEETMISGASDIDETTLLLYPGFSRENHLSERKVDRVDDSILRSTVARPVRRADVSSSLRSNTGISSNLMPVCYSSNQTCTSTTRDCSGHGYCYLKYASIDGAVNRDCYACKCVTTEIKNADGAVKKVTWGGAACEKEDLSSSFFLLAGVTILLVIAIGSGIGMLFSVGQEDLPSVISAGVGGSKDSR